MQIKIKVINELVTTLEIKDSGISLIFGLCFTGTKGVISRNETGGGKYALIENKVTELITGEMFLGVKYWLCSCDLPAVSVGKCLKCGCFFFPFLDHSLVVAKGHV